MKTATATGSVASFWSPKPAAIKSLKVYFEPKQAGEGDPSPDNVRPIEGWNGVEVTHCMARDTSEPQTYTSSWESEVGTVYGGYIDLISGELVQEYAKTVFTGAETENLFYYKTETWKGLERHAFHTTDLDRIIRNLSGQQCFFNIVKYYASATANDTICAYVGTPSKEVCFYIDSSLCEPTVESFKAWLNNNHLEIVYPLQTAVIHQLTPQQLSAFIGRNNLFSNASKVEVEYEYADSPELEVIKKRIALNEPHISNASGSVASFYTDMASPMKSLKVNFEAKQSGTGDPSPDNVRPITGVDQVNVCASGKNICHIVGYSAKNLDTPTAARSLTNNYGTTLSTIDFQLPDSSVVVTQTDFPRTDQLPHYSNGYFTIIEDSMILGKHYNVSFRVTDITNNPLNVSLSDIVIYPPGSTVRAPTVDGDRLIYYDFIYKQHAKDQARHGVEVRNCGMSFTLSEFMVTEVTEEDQTFEPYKGSIIPYDFSELGTQYGGYVDLAKGVLTAEWTKLTTTWGELDSPGTVIENNTRKTLTLPIVGINGEENSIFNAGLYIWSDSQDVPHYYINSTGRVLYVILPNETDDSFPIEVAYKLAEPVTYQLTSQQIKTLRRINNVYSQEGSSVDVEYWLHSDVKVVRKTVTWNQWCPEINADNYRIFSADYATVSFSDEIANVEVI